MKTRNHFSDGRAERRDAVAAVEFAMLIPFILTLILGRVLFPLNGWIT